MAEYYIAPKTSFDATADAIREKTGSQATIEWTQDGFADAISAIGGSSIQNGSFTLVENSKTFTITLNKTVSYMIFYASDYPNGTAGAAWHIVGGVWMNNSLFCCMRYNEANTNYNQAGTVSVTNDSLVVSGLGYNMLAGKTFYWYAW